MRRFDYDDNEEFRDDVDKFFNEESEKYEEIINEEMAIQEAQLEIANRELNHRTLRAAVRICEKSWFWGFYNVNTRMRMISDVYLKIKNLED